MIGKKDFFVPNLFAKISKKRVITKKWRFFYRSMRKKDVIAEKSGERGKKKGIKLAWHYFFLLSLQKKKKFQRTIHIYNNL